MFIGFMMSAVQYGFLSLKLTRCWT